VFAHVGFTTWMPTFLYERFSLSLEAAAFHAVFLHLLFAFFGVLIGGRISDRLSGRRTTIRLEVGCVGLLLGAPCIYLLGASGSLWVVNMALAGFGLFRGFYDSNFLAAVLDVIEPRHHSTATGLLLASGFVISAAAPVLLGYIKTGVGLNAGLSALSAAYMIGAIAIFIASRSCFEREYLRGT
jgi:sugar phosphate permease